MPSPSTSTLFPYTTLFRSQTYGLVGESGSGKTTTGRAVVGLEKATSGQIIFNEIDLTDRRSRKVDVRRDVQMIFQDPYSDRKSTRLNPVTWPSRMPSSA